MPLHTFCLHYPKKLVMNLKVISLCLYLFFSSFVLMSQNYFTANPDFISGTKKWFSKGAAKIYYSAKGVSDQGAIILDVSKKSDKWNAVVLSSAVMQLPDKMQNKYAVLSFSAKSNKKIQKIRIKIFSINTDAKRKVISSSECSLNKNYQNFYLPVHLPENIKKFCIKIYCGKSANKYFFDNFKLEYQPTDLKDVKELDTWQPKVFKLPIKKIYVSLKNNYKQHIKIRINVDDTIAPVLATQIGVNSNFRSKNSLVQRAYLYKYFGAFRFPAGSGSNIYFWDGNIPQKFAISVNAYSGTSKKFLDSRHFIQFKDSAKGRAIVVANYFYARYGTTSEGTRSARVLQAANYAAQWVNFFNIKNNADIKYWEIGNECYGPWETGYNVNGSIVSGTEYGEDFRVFYRQMKKIDSSIKIGAVLSHKNFDWNSQVLSQCADIADFLILHHYFSNISSFDDVKKNLSALTNDMIEVQTLAAKITKKKFGSIPVVLTEYNSQGENTTNINNALFLADMLGTIIKDRFSLSTIWVNEWRINNNTTHGILALDDPDQKNYTPRPSYAPFYFYGKCFGDQMVYSEASDSSNLSFYASIFENGDIGVVFINYSDTKRYVNFEYGKESDNDTIFWYSVYAENNQIGNKKFFVNGITSDTKGGGPVNLDSVPAYFSILNSNSAVRVPKYSVNFFVIHRGKNIQSSNSGDIKIYPNPASQKITVETKQRGNKVPLLFDMSGKNVSHLVKVDFLSSNKWIIDISLLASGEYIVRTKKSSAKFLKK